MNKGQVLSRRGRTSEAGVTDKKLDERRKWWRRGGSQLKRNLAGDGVDRRRGTTWKKRASGATKSRRPLSCSVASSLLLCGGSLPVPLVPNVGVPSSGLVWAWGAAERQHPAGSSQWNRQGEKATCRWLKGCVVADQSPTTLGDRATNN